VPEDQDLAGKLFVSSGLGGMSGAQGKAIEIAGGVGIIAEVDRSRITTRHEQGWVSEVADSPAQAFALAHDRAEKDDHGHRLLQGNIVDLLEYAVNRNVPSICFPTRPPATWCTMAATAPRA
jgi:urocanate hydratase